MKEKQTKKLKAKVNIKPLEEKKIASPNVTAVDPNKYYTEALLNKLVTPMWQWSIAVNYVAEGGGEGAVTSVNGETGAVVLNASDVGALDQDTADGLYLTEASADALYLPIDYTAPVISINTKTGAVVLTGEDIDTSTTESTSLADTITSLDARITALEGA